MIGQQQESPSRNMKGILNLTASSKTFAKKKKGVTFRFDNLISAGTECKTERDSTRHLGFDSDVKRPITQLVASKSASRERMTNASVNRYGAVVYRKLG